MSRDRSALVAQLERLVDWLDACPPELHDRTLTIEIGVDASVRATVDLHANWIARPRDGRPLNIDDAPLGGRTYQSEGATVREALLALHVPLARGSRRASDRATGDTLTRCRACGWSRGRHGRACPERGKGRS